MSEQYIVSARKYRPQTFDTVVGQEHITTTLKNAIRNQHLAHAYLFCGPRGVGKTTCARILARTINCEQPTADTEACGTCPSCKSFSGNASFNIFELDAASNNSVDDIRELVNQVRFAPQQGKYKIYIIDEVHMLSAAAFNAFLKTLEEPPPYAIFILATTEKHKILPTILSRCQIFDFKRIVTADIVAHLLDIAGKESITAQEAALHVIAQKSEGCMRDALSMLDRISGFTNGQLSYASAMEHLNMLDADFYFRLTDLILSQDVSGVLLSLDEVLDKGFEGNVIIEGLAGHLRNLLLCKDQRMVRLLDIPQEHKPAYFEKASQAPPSFILSALNILNDAELNYKNANNKRLHLELCMIRLSYVLPATQSGEKKNNRRNLTSPAAATPPPHGQPAPEAASTAAPVRITPSAAALKQQEQSVPEAAGSAVSLTTTPASGNGNGRRVSRSLLADIDKALDLADVETSVDNKPATLTEEQIVILYNSYRDQLAANNKSVYHAQFSIMKAEKAGDDEIRIIAPSELTATYAREHRNQLIEYFGQQTGIRVRVIIEVRADQEIIAAQQPAVLSKTEIFALMVEKNPSLQRLKDALNMQIEY